MNWLSPADWLAASGPAIAGLARPQQPRGEAELIGGLGADPRRLAMLIGPPGSGTSRLALEIAGSFALARYPDPRAAVIDPRAAVTALARELAGAGGRPLVVLDGPVREDGHTLLAALLAEPIHPGLLVLVPATLRDAQALVGRTGYARTNVIMAMVARAPAASDPDHGPPAALADALAPFALAPRRRADAVAGLDALVATGWVAITGERAIGRLGDALRRRLLAEVYATAGGEVRLRQLLTAEPEAAAPALLSLLRLVDAAPVTLVRAALATGAERLAEQLDALPPWLLAREPALRPLVADVVTAALAGAPAGAAEALHEHLADLVVEPERSLPAVDAALAQATRPERIRRLLIRRALRSREPADQQRALAACRDAGDVDGEARVLAACTAQAVDEDPAAAVALADEWLAIEDRRGDFAARRVALAHTLSARTQLGRWDESLPLARQLVADHRATGNIRRVVFFLHRVAVLLRSTGDRRGAEQALREALALEEVVGYRLGQADCHRGLGELFRADGEPAQAIAHFEQAMALLAQEGKPIEGVQAALEWVRGLLPRPDVSVHMPPPPPPPEPEPEPEPEPPASELVTLRRRP